MGAFLQELAIEGDRPRIMSVSGVGGIGKSRLLWEFQKQAAKQSCRTAVLDFQVPAMRQQEDALAVLRTEIGRQGVRFDRFDIAYAVLWQRLHPNMKLGTRDLPFVQESEVLSSILDLSGVPVFGTALGLMRLADRSVSRRRERRRIASDEVLVGLDDLGTSEVLDAATYLFAQDVRSATPNSQGSPYVLFIDAYEALLSGAAHEGARSSTDAWIRDLLGQLDRGLVVLASREPLGWEAYDPEWSNLVVPLLLAGLPAEARTSLLHDAGVTDPKASRAVAEASGGLPFYLHLAIDTLSHSDGNETPVVSSEEILQRFLNHVPRSRTRVLELLSIARSFDHEIFSTLAECFDLPGDRLTWEAITSYSFVQSSGDNLALHRLMASALRRRLSDSIKIQGHELLFQLWERRATGGGPGESAATREAIYHGVRSGVLAPSDVLRYADRAVQLAGSRAAGAIAADLRSHLGSTPDEHLSLICYCLQAEAAIIMGDAMLAMSIADSLQDSSVQREAGARLAIARAHSFRIAGATSDAGDVYQAVWEAHHGPARYAAALWVADIHMWQGRFRTAFALCQDAIASKFVQRNPNLNGDFHRLMHLGHRFHLDFDSASESLEVARGCYHAADAVIGSANVLTNTAELLAWTEPAEALVAAELALQAQLPLSAFHELGKTYTAQATALAQLGRTAEALDSFDTACAYLERAKYRSGRARAELFRGCLYGREGQIDYARSAIEWAVDEFVGAAVYPTMITAAEQVLARLGIRSPQVIAAAAEARVGLELVGPSQRLEARTATLIDRLVGPRQ